MWSGSSTYLMDIINRSIFFKRLIWKMDALSPSSIIVIYFNTNNVDFELRCVVVKKEKKKLTGRSTHCAHPPRRIQLSPSWIGNSPLHQLLMLIRMLAATDIALHNVPMIILLSTTKSINFLHKISFIKNKESKRFLWQIVNLGYSRN